jgi:hypothetical protein
MAVLFNQTYFSHKDSEQGFMTIYGPIAKYPLPATSISESQLHKIQQPIIISVLSRLGFNPHMSRAVIHASMRYGGVGLIDLYTEQGCGQVSMLMSHLRYNQYLHNSILSLIELFMVLSGNLGSPFGATLLCTYVHSLWIHTIQNFLHKNNATIEIPYLQTIHLIR